MANAPFFAYFHSMSFKYMTDDLPNDSDYNDNSADLVMVTREMVRERTVKLAVRNGRSAQEVWASDWEQAVAELTSEPFKNSPEAVLA